MLLYKVVMKGNYTMVEIDVVKELTTVRECADALLRYENYKSNLTIIFNKLSDLSIYCRMYSKGDFYEILKLHEQAMKLANDYLCVNEFVFKLEKIMRLKVGAT